MTDEKTKVVRVADFTKYPGGRYRTDGKGSAEAFREDHLEPALRDGGRVAVDLDGVLGAGSSFLEEAFGGLVRNHGPEVVRRVTVSSSVHPGLAATALEYMNDAAARWPRHG